MSIFPITQPVIVDNVIRDRGINFLFDFDRNDFIIKDGKFIELTGDAAVVFWIEKCLRTEYEIPPVYRYTGFGTKINSLIGKVLPEAVARNILESNIKESLLKHERIKEINNFTLNQIDDLVEIEFEVKLNPITPDLDYLAGSSKDGFTRISTLEEIKKFLGIKLITSNGFYFKTSLGKQVYVN